MTYRHTQPGWLIVVAVGLAGGAGAVICFLAGLETVGWAIAAVVAVVLALFGSLTITVDDREFRFRMGVGPIGKRVPLAEIRTWRAVTNPWYYGWGIRLYPGGWLYNVSGSRGIEIRLADGKQFRVGSDEPDAVCRALEQALGAPAPLSEAEQEADADRGRRYGVLIAAVVALVLGAVGLLFWAQLQPVGVSITSEGFAIDDAMYDVEIAFSDVASIRLIDRLPVIEVRTNGFALAGVLRGHFRVERLGEGRLYLDTDAGRWLEVILNDGSFVILSLETPDQTTALHRELTNR